MLFFDKNALEKARKIDFLQPKTPVDNYPTLLDFNAIDYASKIKIPTLIIVADKDKVVNPSSSMQLFKTLQCEKKCVVINDSGHSLLLDQKEDEVITHTIQWFNRWLKQAKTKDEENVDEEEEELEEDEKVAKTE
jgi:esterase/lipase